MTKKHFEAIARELKATIDGSDDPVFINGVIATVHAMADVFAGFNGRFDRDRFCRACGI